MGTATFSLLLSMMTGLGGMTRGALRVGQPVRSNPDPVPAVVAPTFRCVSSGSVATLSWTLDVEAPNGPGRFDLAFVDEKVKENDEVTSYVPLFDPLSDLVRYGIGWGSKEFRTTLRIYDREGKTYGDYDSRQAMATGLVCENRLPIRGATITFPEAEWIAVSTDLALIDGLRFGEEDAVVRNREVTLPVRFSSKLTAEKMLEKVLAVKPVRSGQLRRVDGTAVAAPAIVATVKPEPK